MSGKEDEAEDNLSIHRIKSPRHGIIPHTGYLVGRQKENMVAGERCFSKVADELAQTAAVLCVRFRCAAIVVFETRWRIELR